MPLTGDGSDVKDGGLSEKELDENQGNQLTPFEENETNNTLDMVENAMVQFHDKYRNTHRKPTESQNQET